MDLEKARFNMIEQQIRPWDVLDQEILDLLAVVKREQFVPQAYAALAFVDMEIPLPAGENMMPPRVEARILQDLNVRKHENVLEIGAGSAQPSAALPSATSTFEMPASARFLRASATSSGWMSTVSTWRPRLASSAAM